MTTDDVRRGLILFVTDNGILVDILELCRNIGEGTFEVNVLPLLITGTDPDDTGECDLVDRQDDALEWLVGFFVVVLENGRAILSFLNNGVEAR